MYYSYLNVICEIIGDHDILKEMNKLLSDYFYQDETGKKDFSVELIDKNYTELNDVLQYGKEIIIHNSKKPEVHEIGFKYDNGMTRTIFNKTTKSVYFINYFDNHISIYNKDKEKLCKDGIRVVRDIIKIYVEKKNCSALLHAATIEKNGEGILLLGGKGSGKTTISLKMIFDEGFNEVSRDRTFIVKNGNDLELWGWPNYYNLTLRSLTNFKHTMKLIPKKFSNFSYDELQNISKKYQFLAKEIGIDKTVRKVNLSKFIILVNKNVKNNSNPNDILAQNWYTPNDLNYPDWMGFERNKQQLFSNSKLLFDNLTNFDVIEWYTIEEAIEKINLILK